MFVEFTFYVQKVEPQKINLNKMNTKKMNNKFEGISVSGSI